MLRQDDAEITDMRYVLYCIICGRERLSVKGTAHLLGISEIRMRSCLGSLHSVIHVPSADDDGRVAAFHASFGDYLQDARRSGSDAWHLALGLAHDFLLSRCLKTMKLGLYFNIGSFCPHQTRGDRWPTLELKYACRHWGCHLKMASVSHLRGRDTLEFLRTQFLFWVEAIGSFEDTFPIKRIMREILSIDEVRVSNMFHGKVVNAIRCAILRYTPISRFLFEMQDSSSMTSKNKNCITVIYTCQFCLLRSRNLRSENISDLFSGTQWYAQTPPGIFTA